ARQLLTESGMLAVGGGAAGVLLAYGGLPLLKTVLPAGMPRAGEIGINGVVLAFAAAVSLLTGMLFGLLPAVRPGGGSGLIPGGRGVTARNRTARLLAAGGGVVGVPPGGAAGRRPGPDSGGASRHGAQLDSAAAGSGRGGAGAGAAGWRGIADREFPAGVECGPGLPKGTRAHHADAANQTQLCGRPTCAGVSRGAAAQSARLARRSVRRNGVLAADGIDHAGDGIRDRRAAGDGGGEAICVLCEHRSEEHT